MSNTLTVTNVTIEVVTLASFLETRIDALASEAALAERAFLDVEFNDDESVENFDHATVLGWELLQLNARLADARLVLSFEV